MTILSRELVSLSETLRSGRPMGRAELDETGVYVGVLSRLAAKMELELSLFRDMEAGRQIRGQLEGKATEHLSDLLGESGSNVVRPDFRGKP